MGENGREAKAVLQSGALSVINGCECDPELDGGPLYTGGHIQKPVKRRHTQTTYTHAAETVWNKYLTLSGWWLSIKLSGVRLAAGLWVTLYHLSHHNLCPSLHFNFFFFVPVSYQCIIPPFIPLTPSLSLLLFFSLFLSLWASVLLFPPGAITLSLLPSHRLGSKTGAGSWEAINHQKRGIRALLQSKTTADSFTQPLN